MALIMVSTFLGGITQDTPPRWTLSRTFTEQGEKDVAQRIYDGAIAMNLVNWLSHRYHTIQTGNVRPLVYRLGGGGSDGPRGELVVVPFVSDTGRQGIVFRLPKAAPLVVIEPASKAAGVPELKALLSELRHTGDTTERSDDGVRRVGHHYRTGKTSQAPRWKVVESFNGEGEHLDTRYEWSAPTREGRYRVASRTYGPDGALREQRSMWEDPGGPLTSYEISEATGLPFHGGQFSEEQRHEAHLALELPVVTALLTPSGEVAPAVRFVFARWAAKILPDADDVPSSPTGLWSDLSKKIGQLPSGAPLPS
jgi:hypothetical protein